MEGKIPLLEVEPWTPYMHASYVHVWAHTQNNNNNSSSINNNNNNNNGY